jgi:hypothetical protein
MAPPGICAFAFVISKNATMSAREFFTIRVDDVFPLTKKHVERHKIPSLPGIG